jgi:oligopeptide/dipeptide ABC transporter ATP-binding protein
MANEQADNILETVKLHKYFPIRTGVNPFGKRRLVRAVDDVTIKVPRGKTLAVVGESGCGKTTLARTLLLLTQPTAGDVIYDGTNIVKTKLKPKKLYREMQMVFQDPESSLDPRIKIKDIIAEPLRLLDDATKESVNRRVAELMAAVGLSAEHGERLPAHLSGGQKQRVAIARAIAPQPKLVILDEPTSALDASVQAQILTLLLDLQMQFNLTYILITHNIAVAEYLSDVMAVMYAGNLVEYGPTKKIISKPRHPYTVTLISSAPIPNPWKRNLLNIEIKGEVPSAINPPPGCKFNPRCPYADKICTNVNPPLEEISSGHYVACHFVEKTA